MTTITVDEDCLKNVDKLQSLLKLRFDTFSGDTITRGNAVNWAVNQQISAMTIPVNFVYGSDYTTTAAPAGMSTSFATSTAMDMMSTFQEGRPVMFAYMGNETTMTPKKKTHKED